jgi:Flp pilus assembly protein TadB
MFIYLILSIVLAAGFLLVANFSPQQAWKSMRKFKKKMPVRKKTLKERIELAKGTKKESRLVRWEQEEKRILAILHKGDRLPYYRTMSVILAAVGAVLGVVIQNPFLVPIMGLTFAFIPLLKLRINEAAFKKQQMSEIRMALEGVTSSYIRTDDLVRSVRENIAEMHEPIQGVFSRFLAKAGLGIRIASALAEMRGGIQDRIFAQWCDAMILCQSDHTKKAGLPAILDKLVRNEKKQGDAEVGLYNPIRNGIIEIIASVIFLPAVYILYRSIFLLLVTSLVGKFTLALLYLAVYFMVIRMVHAARPIEI